MEWFKQKVNSEFNFGDTIKPPWPAVLLNGKQLFLEFDETTEKYPGCIVDLNRGISWKNDDYQDVQKLFEEYTKNGKFIHIAYIEVKTKTNEYVERISKYSISDIINEEDKSLKLLGVNVPSFTTKEIVDENDFIFKRTYLRYAIS